MNILSIPVKYYFSVISVVNALKVFGSKPINHIQPLDTFELFAVVGDEGTLVGHGGASDQVVEWTDRGAELFE